MVDQGDGERKNRRRQHRPGFAQWITLAARGRGSGRRHREGLGFRPERPQGTLEAKFTHIFPRRICLAGKELMDHFV
jgi:hypothetical protein